jgi:hypothetical protein
MQRVRLDVIGRLLGLAALMVLGGGAIGCVPQAVQLKTERFTLNHPDHWKVEKTAAKDGDPTVVIIPQYGAAVIDEGAGSMGPKSQNYDAVTADVEVRLYTAPDPGTNGDPTQEVAATIGEDPAVQLKQHFVIPDNPPECGVYPKKYMVFGAQQTPVDLVKRPGWRAIVVGGRANGFLLGVVARFEYQPDMQRNCHNLSNMRVQLQNLLDALSANPAPSPKPAEAKPVEAKPAEAKPASGEAAAKP